MSVDWTEIKTIYSIDLNETRYLFYAYADIVNILFYRQGSVRKSLRIIIWNYKAP